MCTLAGKEILRDDGSESVWLVVRRIMVVNTKDRARFVDECCSAWGERVTALRYGNVFKGQCYDEIERLCIKC